MVGGDASGRGATGSEATALTIGVRSSGEGSVSSLAKWRQFASGRSFFQAASIRRSSWSPNSSRASSSSCESDSKRLRPPDRVI